MHILILAPHYTPYVGGAETHTRSLAEALVVHGQDVTVLTDRGYLDIPPSENINGVTVIRTQPWPSSNEDTSHRDQVRWEHELFGLLAGIDRSVKLHVPRAPDIIHAQCQVSFLFGAILKEQMKCPLVVTPHETTPEADGLGEARSRFLFTLPQIDAFIAGSKTFAQQALGFGRPDDGSTIIVESGLHLAPQDVVTTHRPTTINSVSAFTIISVGRFKPRKNQSGLLDAVATVRNEGTPIRCVLAGSCDAGSTEYLEALKVRAQLPDLAGAVTFVENGTDERIKQLVADADLVVQPALAEGLGLVAIEALAAGTVVLSTPTRGAIESIGGYPSLLTAGFSSHDIAAGIRRVLRDPGDHGKHADEAATDVRRRFDSDINSARVLAIYSELVSAL